MDVILINLAIAVVSICIIGFALLFRYKSKPAAVTKRPKGKAKSRPATIQRRPTEGGFSAAPLQPIHQRRTTEDSSSEDSGYDSAIGRVASGAFSPPAHTGSFSERLAQTFADINKKDEVAEQSATTPRRTPSKLERLGPSKVSQALAKRVPTIYKKIDELYILTGTEGQLLLKTQEGLKLSHVTPGFPASDDTLLNNAGKSEPMDTGESKKRRFSGDHLSTEEGASSAKKSKRLNFPDKDFDGGEFDCSVCARKYSFLYDNVDSWVACSHTSCKYRAHSKCLGFHCAGEAALDSVVFYCHIHLLFH